MRLLCLGGGYSAQALMSLLPEGWEVKATTRNAQKAEALQALGAEALLDQEDLTEALDWASHILVSAAPVEGQDPFLARYAKEIAAGEFTWIGYLSTTGVYGDHGGAWVDETTPVDPLKNRSADRFAAEEAWRATGQPLTVFRLAGIYGPGRAPFARIKAGQARRIVKEGQIFSRIHVADIAQALWAAIAAGTKSEIFNLCDDFPSAPETVLDEACRLMGRPLLPSEPFETAQMSPMARSFYLESRKVSSAKIKALLGISWFYPDYFAGLAALYALEERAGDPEWT